MCIGGGKNRRAADTAAVEANRQYEAELIRLREEQAAAKTEADRRAAEEQVRQQTLLDTQKSDAETLRQQLRDQENFRLSEMQRIEAARKSERDADLKRQSDERKQAQDEANARAQRIADYNADRQNMLDGARARVEDSFARYDDGFYGNIAGQVVDLYRPQIAQMYEDARRQSVFRMADKGTLRSTAAAGVFGRLGQQRGMAENEAASRGAMAANSARDQISNQRSALLSSVFSAANAAPAIAGDNVGEVNGALSGLSRSLASPISLAGSPTVTTPSFGALSTVFTPANANSPLRQAGAGANRYASSASGGSGRLVS